MCLEGGQLAPPRGWGGTVHQSMSWFIVSVSVSVWWSGGLLDCIYMYQKCGKLPDSLTRYLCKYIHSTDTGETDREHAPEQGRRRVQLASNSPITGKDGAMDKPEVVPFPIQQATQVSYK